MVRFQGESRFEHGADPTRIGVLLTNLGSPAAPTWWQVRRYLAEFLSDPRVIEVPSALWWPILQLILWLRPGRSAARYRQVWTPEGAPLLVNTRKQARALGAELEALGMSAIPVAWAMRYGAPSIEAGLEELRRAGARRILILPLYPQYSATTTGSTFDAVCAALRRWRWIPELRFVTHYHDHPAYIEALAQSVEAAWRARPRAERLLFSFHGIPKRYFTSGDPYHCECQKTARLTAERLGLEPSALHVSFQSRVGRAQWLTPYTDEVLREWAHAGVRSVDVIAPGFSADCLETLEEIDEEYRDLFLAEGGTDFHYVPALNDRPEHIRALRDLVQTGLRGWEAPPDRGALAASRRRALEMGAPA